MNTLLCYNQFSANVSHLTAEDCVPLSIVVSLLIIGTNQSFCTSELYNYLLNIDCNIEHGVLCM